MSDMTTRPSRNMAAVSALAAIFAVGTSQADCDDPTSYPPVTDTSCPAVPSTAPFPDAACLAYHHIPQCLPKLCWAASGQVVMNSFEEDTHRYVAQWEMVQTGRAPYEIGATYDCYQELPETPCDAANDPNSSLEYFHFKFLPLSGTQQHLSWPDIQAEIAGRGHPFIFEWAYGDGASHYLVVTGYYTTATGKKKLRVWDPLPVVKFDPKHPADIGDLPAAGGSARPIYFDTYAADGGSYDMGRSVVHYADYYQIRPDLAAHASNHHPESLWPVAFTDAPVPHAIATPPSPLDVPIDQARQDSGPAALRYLHELQDEQTREPGGPQTLSLDAPFPIISLGLNDLRAHDGHLPSELLRERTHVVLYPVAARDGVVDSFLTIRNSTGWSEGGYANTTVTQLLNAYRRAYAQTHGIPLSHFYLLSVPALSAFFAVTGSGPGTVLIPASDDESIHATAGVAQPADRLLPDLIAAAKGYARQRPHTGAHGAAPLAQVITTVPWGRFHR